MRLIADNLAGERGGETVFSGVSFDLDTGQSLLVTGPNGAGKSTLLRVVAGLLPASGGSVSLHNGGDDWPDLQSALHFLSSLNAMKSALTVEENLSFWQRFHGPAQLGIGDALERVGLAAVRHLPFGYLSTGQKRRVSIARLFLNYRPIWILDEPTAALDAEASDTMARFLREHLDRKGIVIAATHLPLGLDSGHMLSMGHDHGR